MKRRKFIARLGGAAGMAGGGAGAMTSSAGWSRVRIAAVFLAAAVIVSVTPRFLSVVLPPDPLRNFIAYAAAKPVAALDFKDGDGQVRSLADFNGKVVVLNLWAAWCVPCRKEMPALDRLQAALGGRNFAVVPLSIDRGGRETVAKFYVEIGIRELPVYTDTSGEALRALGAVGLPTTLVLDRAGEEIARIVGPAEWDAPEVVEFLKAMIAKQAVQLYEPSPATLTRRGEASALATAVAGPPACVSKQSENEGRSHY
jgi:thiol-disulfide isomerase/thioredoxin